MFSIEPVEKTNVPSGLYKRSIISKLDKSVVYIYNGIIARLGLNPFERHFDRGSCFGARNCLHQKWSA